MRLIVLPVLIAALTGCWEPKQTGAKGIVGHLKSHDGRPVPGVEFETLEARAVTGADGRFAVNWKDPDRIALARIGDLIIERRYVPEDEGQVVDLVLPALARRDLICDAACTATITWALPRGLTLRRVQACTVGAALPLGPVPTAAAGDPAITCPGATARLVDQAPAKEPAPPSPG
jgi:hypothetical protein